MATYCVTLSKNEFWGESQNRFKTRHEADQRYFEVQAAGHKFGQLVRWENNEPTVIDSFGTPAKKGDQGT